MAVRGQNKLHINTSPLKFYAPADMLAGMVLWRDAEFAEPAFEVFTPRPFAVPIRALAAFARR